MKCNWLRWLWGIIPVAILSWAAVQAERPRIEQELTEAATAQMLRSGASWAQVTLQGRDAVLSGKAWDEADTEAALDALRKQRGVRVVDNKAALVEKAETYVWSASRRNQRIRLSGFVPSAAMRRDILGVAKATFPGFEIVDRMALARGVPAADIWLGGIGFGLTQLAGMRRGEVRLDNLTLSIVGEAEDQAALRAIRQAANNPPRGIKINLNQLAAPAISPYVWTAQVADGKFDLAGYFPDETMQAQLVAAAKAVARDGAVADQMQRGSGAPADWSRATQAAVRALARLESGAAELRDATLLVSGVSADEAAAEAVRALLRADLPASIKLTEQIRAARAPQGSRSRRVRPSLPSRWPRRKNPPRPRRLPRPRHLPSPRHPPKSRSPPRSRRRSPRRRPRSKCPPRPKHRCSPSRRWRPRPRRRSPSPNPRASKPRPKSSPGVARPPSRK